MEVKVRDATVVAAGRAAAAGLGDKCSLDRLLPPSHRLSNAPLAAPSRIASPVESELCEPVARAFPRFDRLCTLPGWGTPAHVPEQRRRRYPVPDQEHMFA